MLSIQYKNLSFAHFLPVQGLETLHVFRSNRVLILTVRSSKHLEG